MMIEELNANICAVKISELLLLLGRSEIQQGDNTGTVRAERDFLQEEKIGLKYMGSEG